jgi:hypothetical protein
MWVIQRTLGERQAVTDGKDKNVERPTLGRLLVENTERQQERPEAYGTRTHATLSSIDCAWHDNLTLKDHSGSYR